MKKRGISAVVATILIILIVVIGVGIVWKVILPLFAELEYLSYSDVSLKIVRQGFTVYDEEQNFAFVQIERGKDEVNVTGIEIGFNFNGTTKTYQSKSVPTPNGKYTYKFNFTNDSDMGIPDGVAPNKVTVAPIFKIKDKVRLGKILDSEAMPVGRIRLSASEWENANKEAATPIVVTTGSGGGDEPGEEVEPVEPVVPVVPLIICNNQNNSAYDNGTVIEECLYGCVEGVCLESSLIDGTVLYMATWSGSRPQGNFGGRSGVDNYCETHKPTNLPASCTNIHGFVSVSDSDELRDMPTVYGYVSNNPLYWWNDATQEVVMFAENWSDMFDGSILVHQEDGTGVDYYTWSGSLSDGSVTQNCNGFTSNANQVRGAYGQYSSKIGDWIYTTYHVGHCTYNQELRCVAECTDLEPEPEEVCIDVECQAQCGGVCGADGTCVDGTSCCGYESGGKCWYVSEKNQACEEVCDLHGGCDGSGWTDPQCNIQKHFFPCGACYANANANYPGYDDPSHCFKGTGSSTCSASSTGIERLCRCLE